MGSVVISLGGGWTRGRTPLCLEPENLKSVAMGASGSKTETLPPVTFDKDGKQLGRYSGKKICCSCPDTKQKCDECVTINGEENCADFIEAHKACLRKEGFKV